MINVLHRNFQRLEVSFRWLLLSDALTLLAMMVGQVALPWWVATAGGARDLATYSVVTSAFAVLAMPIMSPVGDRIAKRRLISTALLALALASASVATLSTAGAYDLQTIAMIGLVPALAMAALTPAVSSFVTELVEPARLAHAFSLQQSAQATGRFIGPALGGLLLGMAGISPSLWLGSMLLLCAAWTARQLPAGVTPPQTRRSWREDLAAGMTANWRVPIERGWITVNFASWIFLFPAFTMLVPVKIQSMGLSGTWFGLCEAGLSIGMLLGALGCSAWCVARVGRYRARVGAAVLQGVALACAGATDTGPCLVACFVAAGFLEATIALVGQTHRMLARPQAYRARMVAGAVMTTYVAGSIGPALAGAALLHFDVREVFMAFGMLGAVAAFCLVAVPGVRAFMALDHESVADYYRRHFPEAFDGPK
jgi:MFS family permease